MEKLKQIQLKSLTRDAKLKRYSATTPLRLMPRAGLL
jgi:hypothetical protein